MKFWEDVLCDISIMYINFGVKKRFEEKVIDP